MSPETTRSAAHDKVWELVGGFQAAMLVTRSASGVLTARPMSHIAKADEGLIYILTERTSSSTRDLETEPMALLTFADNQRYVSLQVSATVSTERGLIERLWNAGAQAFWPAGPADPAVCALMLRPVAGEYWDGDNALSAGVQMIIANVTGNPPDLGDHGRVRM